jgi:hypothetical protein
MALCGVGGRAWNGWGSQLAGHQLLSAGATRPGEASNLTNGNAVLSAIQQQLETIIIHSTCSHYTWTRGISSFATGICTNGM